MNLKERLYAWRDTEANQKGLELWRVLPNRSLDEIANIEPASILELSRISGVGPTKLAVYGRAILAIVSGEGLVRDNSAPENRMAHTMASMATVPAPAINIKSPGVSEKPSMSVGIYLEHVNRALRSVPARVRGEVTQYKFQGNAYFTIKDKDDDAVLDVMMWASDYRLAGIELEPGMEVIIEGFAEVYKAWGRFSFKAKTVEFAGEGALKKQYEALRKKLDLEGVFSDKCKRPLVDFPERIGVITSRTGAVIEDFLNNLGKYGYDVRMIDTRVEGAAAAASVLASIGVMRNEDIDTLVIIRGGGSLESLQSFNNEEVVRALRDFSEKKAPVICAIGHHQDRPLAQMAADYAPSTPTAAAELINESWDRALDSVRLYERSIIGGYARALEREKYRLAQAQNFLERRFFDLRTLVEIAAQRVRDCVPEIKMCIERHLHEIVKVKERMRLALSHSLVRMSEAITSAGNVLDANDPMRQLRLGYSVVRKGDAVIRSIADVAMGDTLEIQVSDGAIVTEIKNKHGN